MTIRVVIVGAYGSAGVSAAETLADHPNVALTLVDNGDPGGGLCILKGCMPSKEVLSAGAHRYQARYDHRLSGTAQDVDLASVIDTKNTHISQFATHRRDAVHALAERDNVEFIHESACFVDDRTVRIGEHTIEADYVVIATGSRVNIPALPGLTDVPVRRSPDVLEATEFADTGIVMGFGYVGLELVPYLAEAADMELTVIEHDDRPLDEADPRFGDEILDLYRRDFDVDIRTNTHEQSVRRTADDRVALTVRDPDGAREEIIADQLFAFTGRRPNLHSLDLDRTALDPAPGWVSDTMQTCEDPQVFVVGDANGKEPILHVAKEQGQVAAENILARERGESLHAYRPTPHHVVFSGLGVYPYARVGHTAATAAAAGIDHCVVTREAEDDGVFKTKDAPYGHASLVVDAEIGTVLGYQGLHYHADVMAKTMQVVIELGVDVRDLPDRAFHPTTPEILDGLFRSAVERVAGDV